MILELALHDAPVLRQKAKPVLDFDEKLHRFVGDLVETLISHKGWGLAAPQVFRSERIFAMSVTEEEEMDPMEQLLIFINPEVISVSKKKVWEEEACLSLPGQEVAVLRPYKITVKAQNIYGEAFQLTLEGMEARCFLHEHDHLDGILISDYMNEHATNRQN